MTEYKTYKNYSTQGLLNLADTFRMALRGINSSNFDPDSLTLPDSTNAIVSASPNGGLRVNITQIEGVLDEAWLRVGLMNNVGRGVSVLSNLEAEMDRALNRHVQSGRDLPAFLGLPPSSGNGPSWT